MSDAELLEMYVEYYNAFASNVTLIITLLFGYIIASVFAAQRLTLYQLIATTTLFVVFTLNVAMGARATCNTAYSLQVELVRRIDEEGSQIAYVSLDGFPEYLPLFFIGNNRYCCHF